MKKKKKPIVFESTWTYKGVEFDPRTNMPQEVKDKFTYAINNLSERRRILAEIYGERIADAENGDRLSND